MNDSSLYEIGLIVSVGIPIAILICICIDIKNIKFNNIKENVIIATIVLFCLVIATFCYININRSINTIFLKIYKFKWEEYINKIHNDNI